MVTMISAAKEISALTKKNIPNPIVINMEIIKKTNEITLLHQNNFIRESLRYGKKSNWNLVLVLIILELTS